MAGNSVIGALRVDLGLNSAQFTAGLKNAQGGLSNFGSVAARGFTAIAAAATIASAALGVAVKGAIDHADALNKSAQKAGVAVEALSRLEYAAKLSDVSLEGLTGGLQKLSKAMLDAAQNGGSQAATAFAALGISIKDSAGNLRDTDTVFADVANRFDRMEDGATKTALAMKVFGKSGAELIPLLNTGRDGLKQMADESDRLGITISTSTARGAEKFNDTLTTISQALQGVVNKVMVAALPALQSLADFLASPEFATGAQTLATNVINGLNSIIVVATRLVNLINQIKTSDMSADGKRLTYGGRLMSTNVEDRTTGAASSPLDYPGLINFDNMFSPVSGNSTFGSAGAMFGSMKPDTFKPIIEDTQAIAAALKAANAETAMWQSLMSEMAPLLDGMQDPFQELQSNLDKLGALLAAGKIDWEEYGDAAFRAQANMVAGVAGLAGELTGALGQIFEDNKAIAVAGAIVNGIESVSKTLATYGVTPWGIAAAGIAATTAALNVANILGTTKTSKSMPSTSGGSAAAASAASSSINLTIRGSGNINVDDFADQLSRSIADGGNQNLIKVIRAA